MPDPRDFLPQPPWDGLPVPGILSRPKAIEIYKWRAKQEEAGKYERLQHDLKEIHRIDPELGRLMAIYVDIAFEKPVSDTDIDWALRWLLNYEYPERHEIYPSRAELREALSGERSSKVIVLDKFMSTLHEGVWILRRAEAEELARDILEELARS